jgi:hypothetical protein
MHIDVMSLIKDKAKIWHADYARYYYTIVLTSTNAALFFSQAAPHFVCLSR